MPGTKLPIRPKEPEEVYAEYDEEYSTWAVFGLNSGFCYAQPSTEKEAEAMAEERNKRFHERSKTMWQRGEFRLSVTFDKPMTQADIRVAEQRIQAAVKSKVDFIRSAKGKIVTKKVKETACRMVHHD